MQPAWAEKKHIHQISDILSELPNQPTWSLELGPDILLYIPGYTIIQMGYTV